MGTPGPDNADVFVDRLVRAGLLAHDPVASAALLGDVDGLSRRSMERRVSRATGLTRGAIGQIRRAEKAVELLARGMSAVDMACRAGYADQPHLTRSLKRFVGQTPSQIGTSAPRRVTVAFVQDDIARPALDIDTVRPASGRGTGAWTRHLRRRDRSLRQLINSMYITLDGVIEGPHLWPALKGGTSDEGDTIQTDLLRRATSS